MTAWIGAAVIVITSWPLLPAHPIGFAICTFSAGIYLGIELGKSGTRTGRTVQPSSSRMPTNSGQPFKAERQAGRVEAFLHVWEFLCADGCGCRCECGIPHIDRGDIAALIEKEQAK